MGTITSSDLWMSETGKASVLDVSRAFGKVFKRDLEAGNPKMESSGTDAAAPS